MIVKNNTENKKDANLKMSVLLLLLHESTQGTDPH